MSDADDERDLVMRAQAGDEHALTDLVRRYHERVYRIAYRIVRDPDDADEVTQEAFARAVAALDRFDFRARFYTWIVSIARNAAFDALRGSKRRSRTRSGDTDERGLDQFSAGETGDPVAASEAREAREVIQKALSRLSPRDRTLIVLREYENLQYEEIAQVLGCSVGTVESGLHRARKRMRYYLNSLAPTTAGGAS